MRVVSLDGAWEFRKAGEAVWRSATVPGCNFTDLLAHGLIPDPFVADNETKVQWVAESDWEYRRNFEADTALLGQDQVFLECDGLDTLATVFINSRKAGISNNMLRPWRFPIRKLIRAGRNEVRIRFASPALFCRKKSGFKGTPGVNDALPGSPFLRKAPCQFGWDWGPKLAPSGIWRSLRVVGRKGARLADVHLRQQHQSGKVTLSAAVEVERYAKAPLRVRLTLKPADGPPQKSEAEIPAGKTGASLSLLVADPKLWWPNGSGPQPLYGVTVELLDATGEVLDRDAKRLGLRTLELRRRKDRWGECFTFVVNGVPIFAKGANWIPADSFPNRVTPRSYRYLLESAARAHMNMLRVWGGGFYEEEVFYDLCDELGLLVWQDFMFACHVYPADAAFFENVRHEVVANVRRLRHRACVALWCGNNEMEQGWADWGWARRHPATAKDGYDRMFHKRMPKWVAEQDPDRAYWPSSASSGRPFEKPNSEERGDGHYWDVWHGNQPITAYRKHQYRFQSEFGFQSLPPFETVKTYAEPRDLNMTSRILEYHQRSGGGNGKIISHLSQWFRMPKDFESLCYASQVLQAEAVRCGVEHWRRHRDRCSGTLYWQLNDCWPVCSWASLDYFGRWKALQYAARRFYAPVLVSVEEEGARVPVWVTNDRREPFQGRVAWRLERLAGEVLKRGELRVQIPAGSSRKVKEFDFAREVTADNRCGLVFVYELYSHGAGGPCLARGVVPFVPSKHLELTEPGLQVVLSDAGGAWQVKLRAKTLARFVEVALEGQSADTVWSDNFFDLPANVEHAVTCLKKPGQTMDEVRTKLRLRSLYDSYAEGEG
jgi:beta-mannosidase